METDEEFEKRMQELAQSYRHLDHLKTKVFVKLNLGWATLCVEKKPEPYELCPCGREGLKYKWCCKENIPNIWP